MSYRIVFSREAASDLDRLFDFALERELESPTGDLRIPELAIKAIRQGCEFLSRSPFSCRKAAGSSFHRELIIPFGRHGYVALFEIVDGKTVIIGAIRHQREDDYH
jgi:plasmid stabilization system protein ParE